MNIDPDLAKLTGAFGGLLVLAVGLLLLFLLVTWAVLPFILISLLREIRNAVVTEGNKTRNTLAQLLRKP